MLFLELQKLSLGSNIAELEAFGFTVIPSEKVAPAEFHAKAKTSLERVFSDRFGSIDGNNGWILTRTSVTFSGMTNLQKSHQASSYTGTYAIPHRNELCSQPL